MIWSRERNSEKEQIMKLESAIRILAGSFVLTSLALAQWVSPYWLLLAAFVGVNLIQSALTGFCPAEIVLKKLGVGGECACKPDSEQKATVGQP